MDLADLADRQIEAHLKASLSQLATPPGDVHRHSRCSECNAEIPVARRKLLPHASTCVQCAEELESVRSIGISAGAW
jgi:phage/conjugal plasmid C-4 type zinc finger TraR family protein